MQLLKNLLQIISFFCIFWLTSLNSYALTTTLSLTTPQSQFINFSGHPKVEALYDAGDLRIIFTSTTGTHLVKEGKKLMFISPQGTTTGIGVLKIFYEDTLRTIDVAINISSPQKQKNSSVSVSKDFNIFSSMQQHRLQERSLSCESSATSDILSYMQGSIVSEYEVIQKLPKSSYYNKLPESRDIGLVWGNPNEGFVGYIHSTREIVAKQKNLTGYGVYEEPISQVYEKYGYETEIINNSNYHQELSPEKHLTLVLGELAQGNMVQLWGDWCTVWKYEDGDISNMSISNAKAQNGEISGKNECYNVLSDRKIRWSYVDSYGEYTAHTGLDGQHAFVLLGWKGDIQNPTHVRVWDTNTGYHEYETIEWMRKWKAMDYRSIIIDKK